jgi:hypothetical protein
MLRLAVLQTTHLHLILCPAIGNCNVRRRKAMKSGETNAVETWNPLRHLQPAGSESGGLALWYQQSAVQTFEENPSFYFSQYKRVVKIELIQLPESQYFVNYQPLNFI